MPVSSDVCTLIHPGPPGTRRAPLFLLHDGGGTIFSYFLLKPLNRPIYGIANPKVEQGQNWDGGLHQMAAEYLKVIKEVAAGRPVLLGGENIPFALFLKDCTLTRELVRLVTWWSGGI